MSSMGDMATMTPVKAVSLPAGKQVRFAPGGYHIMLVGLKEPLLSGAHVALTLHFGHAADRTVDVEVRD
jgi:hypothetical protein